MTSPSRSNPSRSNPARSNRSAIPLVVALVVAVIAVAVVVTVLLTGGDDDDAGESPTTPPAVPVDPDELDPRLPPELVGEVRPVEVEGDPLPPFADEIPDPAIGVAPPAVFMEDATGFVHTISPDIDGAVMLVFLAHWCPACNQEVPVMVQLANEGRVPDNLTVYAVLTGMDAGRPNFPGSRWLADFGWPFVAVADEPDLDAGTWKAADAYGLRTYPYVVIVDGGVVVDRWSGVSTPASLAARIGAAVS